MNRSTSRCNIILLISLLVANPSRAQVNQKAHFSWRQSASSLALLNHEHVVWQFNHLGDGVEKGCPYFQEKNWGLTKCYHFTALIRKNSGNRPI